MQMVQTTDRTRLWQIRELLPIDKEFVQIVQESSRNSPI
jgi:hypothetical protein